MTLPARDPSSLRQARRAARIKRVVVRLVTGALVGIVTMTALSGAAPARFRDATVWVAGIAAAAALCCVLGSTAPVRRLVRIVRRFVEFVSAFT